MPGVRSGMAWVSYRLGGLGQGDLDTRACPPVMGRSPSSRKLRSFDPRKRYGATMDPATADPINRQANDEVPFATCPWGEANPLDLQGHVGGIRKVSALTDCKDTPTLLIDVVLTVDFEGRRRVGGGLGEVTPSPYANQDGVVDQCVVDRKDHWVAADEDSDPAQDALSKQPKALGLVNGAQVVARFGSVHSPRNPGIPQVDFPTVGRIG